MKINSFDGLPNAPSQTGNPSGGGRGNKIDGAGWPSTNDNPSGGGRDNK